jgi:hypothetical protein
VEVLQCVLAGVLLASAALVAERVIAAGHVSVGSLLQADALSAWLDLIIGVVGSSGTLYAVGYVGEEMDRAHLSLRRYRQFFCLFDLYLGVMLLAANLENIVIMWIAIEGSTLSRDVDQFVQQTALAGWKCIIRLDGVHSLDRASSCITPRAYAVCRAGIARSQLYQAAESWIRCDQGRFIALIGCRTKRSAPMPPLRMHPKPSPGQSMLSAQHARRLRDLRFKAVTDRLSGKLC